MPAEAAWGSAESNLTGEDLARELEAGGTFVLYTFTSSVIVLTFRRPSPSHFVRTGESRIAEGLGYAMTTLLLGRWGSPWGPIFSIAALATNLAGGKDVTAEVVRALRGSSAAQAGRLRREAMARQRDAAG